MGLDMWLHAKRYLWSDSVRPEETPVKKTIAHAIGAHKDWETKEVSCLVAQWRKSNAVHGWFVENVQDGEDNCQEYEVSREKLQALVNDIDEVLGARMRASKAMEKLPPVDGPFFGSFDLDEHYYNDLEYTKMMALDALAAPKCWDFYYSSSW